MPETSPPAPVAGRWHLPQPLSPGVGTYPGTLLPGGGGYPTTPSPDAGGYPGLLSPGTSGYPPRKPGTDQPGGIAERRPSPTP
ncbi:hypothetical protein I553_0190 [Mycobacterium xenopi 4042]|uniref:Uncharacterized protein n=1 Tax=Mycobacterium xenopi 4042 TaxID=1299334 RepID=X7YIP6_MYCXE|nr:hypothetical protein I553_0190 [Mycobacterium xenopi 4042]